jgi:3-methyl-2-oxobutanoate hydroxymethyltransferase
MSSDNKVKKITVPAIMQMKKDHEKISALTAYDHLMASILDEAGLDIILVGDSAGMVLAGFESTIPVTMDMMLYHTAAVKRGVQRALLVADMPFMSYQVSMETAVFNAGRFLQVGGAEAVKLEGGEAVAETVRKLVGFGIPVMGHLGLTPQSINQFGGYIVIGKEDKAANLLLKNSQILEQAGVFALVLEKIPALVAKEITAKLKIPTIGIGAGKYCDGQVLVTYDMLGMFERFQPKFARRYANLAEAMRTAFTQYNQDVKSGHFPDDSESY